MKTESIKTMLERIDDFSLYFDSLDGDLHSVDETGKNEKTDEITKLKEHIKNIEQFKQLLDDLNDKRFLKECDCFSYWFVESITDMGISWDNFEEEGTIDYLKETAKNNDISFEMICKLLKNATFFQDVDGVMYYDDKTFQKSLKNTDTLVNSGDYCYMPTGYGIGLQVDFQKFSEELKNFLADQEDLSDRDKKDILADMGL